MRELILWYYHFDDRNYVEDVKSPMFLANDKNILFLNFITSIRTGNGVDIKNSESMALNYIKENISIFTPILSDFSKEYGLEDEDIFEIFDEEILSMLIEYMDDAEYIPSIFWDYDAESAVNPNGLSNGNAVIAYEDYAKD